MCRIAWWQKNKAGSVVATLNFGTSWQTASKAVILDSRISSSCVVCSALIIARALSASASFGAPFNRSVTILGRGFRLLSLLREREKDIMEQFRRSSDSTSSDLIPFAVAVHAIF